MCTVWKSFSTGFDCCGDSNWKETIIESSGSARFGYITWTNHLSIFDTSVGEFGTLNGAEV